jgi:hypothetical protein
MPSQPTVNTATHAVATSIQPRARLTTPTMKSAMAPKSSHVAALRENGAGAGGSIPRH